MPMLISCHGTNICPLVYSIISVKDPGMPLKLVGTAKCVSCPFFEPQLNKALFLIFCSVIVLITD
jgi:hypothetical protein